jgi:hypothetical protein
VTLLLIPQNQVLPTNIFLIEHNHTIYKVELNRLSQTRVMFGRSSEEWREGGKTTKV